MAAALENSRASKPLDSVWQQRLGPLLAVARESSRDPEPPVPAVAEVAAVPVLKSPNNRQKS